MKLSTKVARNTLVQILSKVIATLLGLATVALMTRYLGQSGFGEYTTIMTFIAFFATFADFGLTLVTVQLISQPDADEQKILDNLFSFRLISAVFMLGLGIAVSLFFPYSLLIKKGIALASAAYVFIAMNQILVGLFQKHLKMEKIAMAEVISRTVLLFGVALVLFLDYGLMGILSATVVSGLISFLVHYFYARRISKIKLEFDFSFWKKIISKSWPLAVTIFFNLIYLKADTLILSLVKTQNDVGIYGAAYKVIDVVVTIPFMFAGLVLPILTSSWAKNDFEFFSKAMQKSFDVMVIAALPLFVGTLFVADRVMRIVAGSEFVSSGKPLKILMLAAMFIFFGSIFAHAIIAIDKQREVIRAYIFTAISSLIGYLIFIPRFSYLGAAWMTVYSEGVIALFSFILIIKYTKFNPKASILFKSMAASAVMGIFLYFALSSLNTILLIGISSVVYFVSLYIFGGIKRQEILDVINK